jgi:hypothetical protein
MRLERALDFTRTFWSSDVSYQVLKRPITWEPQAFEAALSLLPRLHWEGQLQDLASLAAELHQKIPSKNPDLKTWLQEDILLLTELFLELLGGLQPRYRACLTFEWIDHDACRLFHTDYHFARLITTYVGPGTEYLLPHQGDRTQLGKGSNAALLRDVEKVSQLGREEIMILKGERMSHLGSKALIHRSPPIQKHPSGSQERRLVLRVT